MPSLAMYQIAPPKDEKEFEHILLDYGQAIYGGAASLFGRKGQAQHGIDVVVNRLDGSRVCIQCKDYTSIAVTKAKIDGWIAEAEQSEFEFQKFVIAVASHTDARLQEYVYRLSDQRTAAGKFAVDIIFWENIEYFIKQRLDLLRLYYPMLYHKETEVTGLIQQQWQEQLTRQPSQQEWQEQLTGQSLQQEWQEQTSSRLVMSEAQLRGLFLEELVKYRIPEMLRADPFVGFDFELVVDSDCFQISVQNLLDRAIGIHVSGRFMQIDEFRWALDAFAQYLSGICEINQNGTMVRYTNPFGDRDRNADVMQVEELRRRAMECLEAITDA